MEIIALVIIIDLLFLLNMMIATTFQFKIAGIFVFGLRLSTNLVL
jgi:hypothetical protein